ncbi:nucleotide exchange factor GrpE [bacterium]|nr:nucleotide exchange factor GrpE [bacterium]
MEAKKDNKYISIPIEGGESEQSADRSDEKEPKEIYVEQLQRLQAEFANYRRRTEKEKESLSTFIKGNFIAQLLPILDDLDLLVKHHEEDHQCPIEAIQLIIQKLKKILFDEGLESIDALDQTFNPDIHEAIAVEEVEEPKKDGVVLEEWQKGYQFHGSLLRPSRVKVAKLKAMEESD